MSNSDVVTFTQRTEALLGTERVMHLSGSCIAIAGVGGVGGAILSTIVRMGIGRFRIADPGIFDLPDLNRQWAATHATLDRNKAEVYGEFIKSINPEAEVEVFTEGVQEDNISKFLDGADLLIEALDVQVEPSLRIRLCDQAQKQGIYSILAPIIAFGTVVATASPDGMKMDRFLAFIASARSAGKLPPGLSNIFNPDVMQAMERSMATGVIPSVASSTALVASVVAVELLMILGGEIPGKRSPICLPELIMVDLARMCFHVKHIKELEEG